MWVGGLPEICWLFLAAGSLSGCLMAADWRYGLVDRSSGATVDATPVTRTKLLFSPRWQIRRHPLFRDDSGARQMNKIPPLSMGGGDTEWTFKELSF